MLDELFVLFKRPIQFINNIFSILFALLVSKISPIYTNVIYLRSILIIIFLFLVINIIDDYENKSNSITSIACMYTDIIHYRNR